MEPLDPQLLLRQHRSVPRYTSYPTAPCWGSLASSEYAAHIHAIESPISLYVHIPFCQSMCLYCACNVVLNRKPENEERYVAALCREIELLSQCSKDRLSISHIHFGGGTPTQLSIPLLDKIMNTIRANCISEGLKECAIEVDPRTVVADGGEKLKALRRLGFDRISLGVQDTNPRVQAAVRRHQTRDMTQSTFDLARELGFVSINMDFIYGLPYQTRESFAQTIAEALVWAPDRIALFSYAHLPELKLHQKAIRPQSLPSLEEKFCLYTQARTALVNGGYQAIGMDHFAKQTDPLAISYQNKTLWRNFQGYTIAHTPYLVGIGSTAISMLDRCYAQNTKDLPLYYEQIHQNHLPVVRGCILSDEDLLRRDVIQSLMCRFEIDKQQFHHKYGILFENYFSDLLPKIGNLVQEGLLMDGPDRLHTTPLGELFVRNIASVFDHYLHDPSRFSSSI